MNENEEVASGKISMDVESFLFILERERRKGKESAQSEWEIYMRDLGNNIRTETAKDILGFLEHEFAFDEDGMVVINKHGLLKEIKKRYGV